MDYKTAMQTAIDAQSSLFGTQIGGVQSQLAANEARRIADQQAAAAAAEAQRQADQKATAARERQANIRTTATQAQTSAQGIMQQLEAMQRAGMTPQQAQLVEAGPGFDVSAALNTGFFSGFQAKKAQQNQQPTTKIAAGGYIDDLLAGDLSVDELLDLLR
jgi:murein L,D-transpeptidase YcbB/YkuD